MPPAAGDASRLQGMQRTLDDPGALSEAADSGPNVAKPAYAPGNAKHKRRVKGAGGDPENMPLLGPSGNDFMLMDPGDGANSFDLLGAALIPTGLRDGQPSTRPHKKAAQGKHAKPPK